MNTVLNIVPRTSGGKKLARKLRHDGFVPGIIYGADSIPISVSVGAKELSQLCYHSAFFNHIIQAKIGDKVEKILPRIIDFHPVTDEPIHVDFQRVTSDSKIKVSISVEFINEEKSPGMKKGGLLNIVVHQLECFCLASNIPEKIVIDLSGKDIGEGFELSGISFPDGVVPAHAERDAIIATIVGARTTTESTEQFAQEETSVSAVA
ncbi:MAG: 50S ribosomal protein L25/general stress protein Ctc [Holosporales bacterium]|jgi:large subunit ribosomal protein L25|nr:50S ribosomal protein L25/general stress protein Ctc [Holosporales bacterium]